jgi:hypothetical protein
MAICSQLACRQLPQSCLECCDASAAMLCRLIMLLNGEQYSNAALP